MALLVLSMSVAAADETSVDSQSSATQSPADIYGSSFQDPWYTSLGLGVHLLPKYAADGSSEGLSESRFVGFINIDSVWSCPDKGLQRFATLCFGKGEQVHFGGTVLLSGTPTQNAERNSEERVVESPPPCGTTGVVPGCFNDIDDVVTFSAYLDIEALTIGRTRVQDLRDVGDASNRANTTGKGKRELYYRETPEKGAQDCGPHGVLEKGGTCSAPTTTFGWIARASVQSRSQLGTDNDTAVFSASLGVKLTSHRYRARGYRNGIPNGFAELSLAYFEEYAGQTGQPRIVFNVQRSFLGDKPLYLGAYGNFGSGEDVFGVSLVYLLQPEGLISLFGGNVQN